MKSLPVCFLILTSISIFTSCGNDESLTYVASDGASAPATNIPTTSIPKADTTSCLALSSTLGNNINTNDDTLDTQKDSCISYFNSLVSSIKSIESDLSESYDLEFVTQYNYVYLQGSLFDESYDSQSSYSSTKSKLSSLESKLESFPTQMPSYMQDQSEFLNYFSTRSAKKTYTSNLIKFMEDCPYHEQYCNDNACQCAYMMPAY